MIKSKIFLVMCCAAVFSLSAMDHDDDHPERALTPKGYSFLDLDTSNLLSEEGRDGFFDAINRSPSWSAVYASPAIREFVERCPDPVDFLGVLLSDGRSNPFPSIRLDDHLAQDDTALGDGGMLSTIVHTTFPEEHARLGNMFLAPDTLHRMIQNQHFLNVGHLLTEPPVAVAQLFFLHHVDAFLSAHTNFLFNARQTCGWGDRGLLLINFTGQLKRLIRSTTERIKGEYADAYNTYEHEHDANDDEVAIVPQHPLLKPFNYQNMGEVIAVLPLAELRRVTLEFKNKLNSEPLRQIERPNPDNNNNA